MSRSSVLGQVVSSSVGDRVATMETLESRQLLAASIAGTVFADLNKNGVQDAGEAGIVNVEMTLTGRLRGGGAVKVMAQTDKKGRFRFDNLGPGKYTVSEKQPEGFKDGKEKCRDGGSSVGNDVVANIRLGMKGKCVLTFTERPKNPATPAPVGSISGYVYDDADADGMREEGEAGIAGVHVSLVGTTGDGVGVQRTAVTDAEGRYQFLGLRAGTYSVVAAQVEGFVDGGEAAGNVGGVAEDDQISNIVLAAGQDGVGYNFGELRPGSISGKVFIDSDGDGVMDAGEPGVPDVLVTLTGTDDLGESVMVSTRTDQAGAYEFTGLRAGIYQVVETQPFGLDEGQGVVGSAGGVAAVNAFSEIPIGVGVAGTEYNFTETFREEEQPPAEGDGEMDLKQWRGKWRRLLEYLQREGD